MTKATKEKKCPSGEHLLYKRGKRTCYCKKRTNPTPRIEAPARWTRWPHRGLWRKKGVHFWAYETFITATEIQVVQIKDLHPKREGECQYMILSWLNTSKERNCHELTPKLEDPNHLIVMKSGLRKDQAYKMASFIMSGKGKYNFLLQCVRNELSLGPEKAAPREETTLARVQEELEMTRNLLLDDSYASTFKNIDDYRKNIAQNIDETLFDTK